MPKKNRIDYLIEHDRIDLHRDVVSRDHCLRREVGDSLLQRNTAFYLIDKRHFRMKSRIPCRLVSAQTFNDKGMSLRYNANIPDKQNQNGERKNAQCDESHKGCGRC
jgi:hypothetical protein